MHIKIYHTVKLKWWFFSALLFFQGTYTGCKRPCDKSLRFGEIVQIPVEFVGFSLNEINQIRVYRIDKLDPNAIDTFSISEILWASAARSFHELITDNTPYSVGKRYGDYESYFDNCDLVFNWQTGSDTLIDLIVKKSKEKIKGCHRNDPNVQIDQFTFRHKGKTVIKNESIRLEK